MDKQKDSMHWSENVIIADADYIDHVAFDLTVNFERMLGRRVAKADLARWIDCVALDGGLREGDNQVQVALIHRKDRTGLENFAPADYAAELHGKAFSDNLGEFHLGCYPIEEVTDGDSFLLDMVQLVCAQQETRRVMIVPNAEHEALYEDLRRALRDVADDKRVTVFAMQPMAGGNFRQEILGYSMMNALGIRADEIHAD